MGGCTQYQYANYSANYIYWGKGSIRLQLINQRSDFSFALFTGGLHNVRDDYLSTNLTDCQSMQQGRLIDLCVSHRCIHRSIHDMMIECMQPKLIAVSEPISFKNPKAPVFPRLALGRSHDEMTVTWTSGYDISEAYPFVEWGALVGARRRRPAADRAPARWDAHLQPRQHVRRAGAHRRVAGPRLHPHRLPQGPLAQQGVSTHTACCHRTHALHRPACTFCN